MTIPKIKRGEVIEELAYTRIGAGAVEFARRYFSPDMEYYEAYDIATELINAVSEDPRIIRCCACGYFFEDKTKNKIGKYCSKECKSAAETISKRHKRKAAGSVQDKFRERYYHSGLEYPFWDGDWMMREHDRRKDLYSYADVNTAIAKDQIRGLWGGTKRNTSSNHLYGSDDKSAWSNKPYKPSIAFYGESTINELKASPVVVIKRSKAEIEADLLARYGSYHLTQERRRALLLGSNLGADKKPNSDEAG